MLFGYYKYIDRNKFVYDCIVDEDSPHVPYNEVNSLGGNLIFVPPYRRQPAYQKALYTLFTSNHYPLVYSHLNTLSVFPLFAAWRAGIPIRIAHNHTTAGRGKGEFLRNVMKYTLRPFSKIFPTHLCACSKFAGRWLFGDKAMNAGRVKIWNNAVELERYAYNEKVRNDTRQSLKLSDKFVVGHSGRFEHQKNHDFLVDIFAEIHRRRNDAVLLLAGDGPLMGEVTGKVKRLGLNDSVVFLGNVSDMERYYQAMDVFIFPSLYEFMESSLKISRIVLCIPSSSFICSSKFALLLRQISITVPAFVFMFSSPLAIALSAYFTTASFVLPFDSSFSPSYSPSENRDERRLSPRDTYFTFHLVYNLCALRLSHILILSVPSSALADTHAVPRSASTLLLVAHLLACRNTYYISAYLCTL